MQPKATPTAARCEARTRSGGRCQRPAGWGTGHRGRGRCAYHCGKTPTHERRCAREEAVEKARELLVGEVSDDPIEAMLEGVRVASAIVAYHRQKLVVLDQLTRADEEAYEQGNLNRQRIAEMALRAGVAEKLVQITERLGEQLANVCQAGLAALVAAGAQLTNPMRLAYVEAVTRELRMLERADPSAMSAPDGARGRV